MFDKSVQTLKYYILEEIPERKFDTFIYSQLIMSTMIKTIMFTLLIISKQEPHYALFITVFNYRNSYIYKEISYNPYRTANKRYKRL